MLRVLFVSLVLVCPALAARVWQPIIDYTISFPGVRPGSAPLINSFENFTHFSSDFGWMGPGQGRIDAEGGMIRVKPEGQWTGAWHSLAGLATQKNRVFDSADLLGIGGEPAKKSGIRALAVNVGGRGTFRLELADVQRKVIWKTSITLDDKTIRTHVFPIAVENMGRLKLMNWIAEPGCELHLSSIGFMADRPEMPLEEWAFRISLGKLRRCHDAASGFTRDRGHLHAGDFDSVASTGMHALASALGVTEGILTRETVISELDGTLAALRKLRRASGFLPHFTHRGEDGRHVIVPGTEFSTVDTAIALQSLLLATRILDLTEQNRQVAGMIAEMDFDVVTDADGWISHGFQDDGKTLLQSKWRDWGGETALVLALEAMIPNRRPRGKMLPTGQPYRGVGFIAEIQSLFYPDFDNRAPDLVSGISWPDVRHRLLREQIAYPKQHWPESAAARSGIFGLSAGEAGMPGAGYTANGVEVMGVRWLHPHYMFMGLGLGAPDLYPKGLRDLDAEQFLYPLGLTENIEVDFQLHNPMQGSLNASFETLAAYHGWKKRRTPDNQIDTASQNDPLLRKGAARFYDPGLISPIPNGIKNQTDPIQSLQSLY
jgi:hypothetical protein